MDGKRNVFENIVAELKGLIRVGALKNGDKLPSVRAYAVDRKVNPNTVAKAYAILEEEGFIRVQPKKGAYVTCQGCEADSALAQVKAQVVLWKVAGIEEEKIVNAVREVYQSEEVKNV